MERQFAQVKRSHIIITGISVSLAIIAPLLENYLRSRGVFAGLYSIDSNTLLPFLSLIVDKNIASVKFFQSTAMASVAATIFISIWVNGRKLQSIQSISGEENKLQEYVKSKWIQWMIILAGVFLSALLSVFAGTLPSYMVTVLATLVLAFVGAPRETEFRNRCFSHE